jgi:hypothetical protein
LANAKWPLNIFFKKQKIEKEFVERDLSNSAKFLVSFCPERRIKLQFHQLLFNELIFSFSGHQLSKHFINHNRN